MKKATSKTAKANKVNNAKKATAKAVPVSTKPKLVLTPQQIATAKKLIAKLPKHEIDGSVGKIKQILQLFTNGFKQAEIIAYGFNKSTVYRQTRELTKLKSLQSKKQVTAKAVHALKGTN